MPLPMVHLAIAIKLAESWPSARTPEFLLGSLSPDAIHMRPRAGTAEKDATHYRDAEGKPDLARIQTLLMDGQHSAGFLPAFAAGYAAHLIADRLWIATCYSDFKRQLAHLDPEARRTLYYLETDQVDFNLYRQTDWRRNVWDQLDRAVAPDFPPLLSASEIESWRERTLHWFDELMKEPKIVPQYITDALAYDFTDRAAKSIADLYSIWLGMAL